MTHIENESDESNLDDDSLIKHGSLSQQSERQQLGRPQRTEGQGEQLESRGQQSESQRHLADLSGAVIANHYELLDLAGQGNISSIYRARHLLINKIMAVKVLKSHNLRKANLVMRFQREAKLLSALDHPNIIKFHEFGVHSTEQPYLVLEFVDGRTLEDYITCEGPLELVQALEIIIQVCDALEYMHERDVVHRDLKPENIMLAPSESGAQVKLIDFGFADEDSQEDHQDLTKPGSVFGTPNYMSSEQQLGFNVDNRSDIYSLVSVLFFTLTGTPPFKGKSTMETLQKRVSETPPSLVDVLGDSDVTRRLDHVIARGMANNPDDRYGHINQLRDRLIKIYELAGAEQEASPESPPEEAPTADKKKSVTPRSNTPALAAAIAICVLCLGGSLFILWKSTENSQEGSSEAGNTTSTRRLESLWKKADMQGQQQFNSGRYDEAAKSFEKSLRFASRIDPKGEMVKGSLEELIDLAVAAGKEPDPAWLKSLSEINARERATLIADAKALIPILTRIANGEKIEAVINTTGGASSESLNDLSRVIATRKPLKAGEKRDSRAISLEDLCMLAMSRALKLKLSNESTLCYELTEKARLAALTLPPEKRSIMTELVFFQTSFGSSAGEGQKSSDLASQSMPEVEKELKKPRKGQLTVEDGNKFVRAYIIATKSLNFDKAHEYLSEAIILYSQVLGHDSIQVANCLTYDAQLYADQGMFVEARERALDALKIYLGPSVNKNSDLYHLNDVANLYIFLGKKDMAMKTLVDALNLHQKAVLKDWTGLADCLVQMTHIGITSRKPEGMDFLCRRAIAIIKRTHPFLKSGPARATRMLGELSKLRGRVNEAESYFKQALQMDLAENKKLALATAAEDYRALADLYFSYDTTNGYRSCVEACQKQVQLLDSVYGSGTLSVVPAKTLMAKALLRLGEIGKADALIGELENFLAKSDRLNPKERTAVMLVKADSFEKKGNKAKAEELRTKANRL